MNLAMSLDSHSVMSISAAFVAGVLGSVHCLAMCGGLAGALGMRARTAGFTPARTFSYALLTQVGRIGCYALVGAMVGGAGAVLGAVMTWIHLSAVLRLLAGGLLLAIAARIVFAWNLFAGLERMGARLWSVYLSRLAPANVSRPPGAVQSLILGAVWAWLPCGLVYSMLLFAALAGSALQGMWVMMAFGAGTLPAMMATSLLAAQLARVLQVPRVRWLAAGALAAMGAWTLISALQHGAHRYLSA